MDGSEQLWLQILVPGALPLVLCGIAGAFRKNGPLLLGAALTWISLFVAAYEFISHAFHIPALLGFTISAAFLLGSILATVAGGLYLLIIKGRVP
jgi:hypothetical protein